MKRTRKIVALILSLAFVFITFSSVLAQAKVITPRVKVTSSLKSTYYVYQPISVTVTTNYSGKVKYRAYIKDLKTRKVVEVFTAKDKFSTATNGLSKMTFTTRATKAGKYQIVVMAKRDGSKKAYESITYTKTIVVKDTKAALTNVSVKLNEKTVVVAKQYGNTFKIDLSKLKDSDRVTNLLITANKDGKVNIIGKYINLTGYKASDITAKTLGLGDKPPTGATMATLRKYVDSKGYLSQNIDFYSEGKKYTYVIQIKVK